MVKYIDKIKDKIKDIAKKLLAEKKVDMVIGFKKGTLPLINEPYFAKTVDQVENLVWDSCCSINLANYLTNRKEKIAIIAKGCDSRNIVNHIIENKIKRDQIIIIGVPCQQMIDRQKLSLMFEKNEIIEVIENEDKITVKFSDSDQSPDQIIDRNDVISDNCLICTHRNPVIYDELAADLVKEAKDINKYEAVNKIEEMSTQEKQNYFDKLFSNCIRCYACRNACPLCYCPTCFVDESKPQWVGKSDDSTDIKTFHFLRAYHCAGRCTDCGSCERACPMGIKLKILTKKLEKDCVELWDWEAGLDVEKRPALETFRPDDSNESIK